LKETKASVATKKRTKAQTGKKQQPKEPQKGNVSFPIIEELKKMSKTNDGKIKREDFLKILMVKAVNPV
jgi:hypothetical protein